MQPVSQVTIDDFVRLTPADHAVGIHLYSQTITQLEARLTLPGREDAREVMLDELRRCQQLRKLHVQALAEQLEVVSQREAA